MNACRPLRGGRLARLPRIRGGRRGRLARRARTPPAYLEARFAADRSECPPYLRPVKAADKLRRNYAITSRPLTTPVRDDRRKADIPTERCVLRLPEPAHAVASCR
jgi:hypothetical protein